MNADWRADRADGRRLAGLSLGQRLDPDLAVAFCPKWRGASSHPTLRSVPELLAPIAGRDHDSEKGGQSLSH